VILILLVVVYWGFLRVGTFMVSASYFLARRRAQDLHASSMGSCPEPEGAPKPAVVALKTAVSDITQTPAGKRMVQAYGSEPYAFERFLNACNNNVPKAESRFRDTFAFRTRSQLDAAPSTARKHEQRAAPLVGNVAFGEGLRATVRRLTRKRRLGSEAPQCL
jgi:hypothetical protein